MKKIDTQAPIAEDVSVSSLLDLDHIEQLLDQLGLGSGAVTAEPLGDGHSNLTFLLTRRDAQYVLRRPPKPPYPPSAHDVLREAEILEALGRQGLPVPAILAKVEDLAVIGVPFVVMEFVDGVAFSTALPERFAPEGAAIGNATLTALAAIHAVDPATVPSASRKTGAGYLDGQLRRFARIRDATRIRPIEGLDEVGAWLSANRPASSDTTMVHGDFRLGNLLFARKPPARVAAVLDWELATVGDPLADVGYLCATWAEAADPEQPMLALSGASRRPGFPTRADLAAAYAELTGRDVSPLPWYEILAMWKASIFLETSYGRFLDGRAADPYFASLERAVPEIVAAAWEKASRA
jgi:aminoglycoside phosphotransferase (APT) family kinase protein